MIEQLTDQHPHKRSALAFQSQSSKEGSGALVALCAFHEFFKITPGAQTPVFLQPFGRVAKFVVGTHGFSRWTRTPRTLATVPRLLRFHSSTTETKTLAVSRHLGRVDGDTAPSSPRCPRLDLQVLHVSRSREPAKRGETCGSESFKASLLEPRREQVPHPVH